MKTAFPTKNAACSQWMLLAEGIRNSSTIDKREMNIFFNQRRFWKNVLERETYRHCLVSIGKESCF